MTSWLRYRLLSIKIAFRKNIMLEFLTRLVEIKLYRLRTVEKSGVHSANQWFAGEREPRRHRLFLTVRRSVISGPLCDFCVHKNWFSIGWLVYYNYRPQKSPHISSKLSSIKKYDTYIGVCQSFDFLDKLCMYYQYLNNAINDKYLSRSLVKDLSFHRPLMEEIRVRRIWVSILRLIRIFLD